MIRPLNSYNPSGSYPCGRQKRPKCCPGSGFAREYRACPLPEENPTQDYITVSCTTERRRRTTTTAGSVSRIAESKRVGEVSLSRSPKATTTQKWSGRGDSKWLLFGKDKNGGQVTQFLSIFQELFGQHFFFFFAFLHLFNIYITAINTHNHIPLRLTLGTHSPSRGTQK